MKLPSAHDKDPQRRAIGNWIARKRRAYHRGELSQLWIDKFEQTFREWSWSPASDRVQKNKKQLLEMARNKEPRPNQKKTYLGETLSRYTNGSDSYDAKFDEQIREAGSNWFINTSDENKKHLLKIARKGKPRPKWRTQLGRALGGYIQETGSSSYDPKFKKQIREVSPRWFVNAVKENKEQLLEMARKGEPRPSRKTESGRALSNYTNKSHGSYDSKFDKQIRQLAPYWFINTADEKKKQLLEMARKEEPRPKWKIKLGQALSSYINKISKSYDPKFDKQIRQLAPHWFKS